MPTQHHGSYPPSRITLWEVITPYLELRFRFEEKRRCLCLALRVSWLTRNSCAEDAYSLHCAHGSTADIHKKEQRMRTKLKMQRRRFWILTLPNYCKKIEGVEIRGPLTIIALCDCPKESCRSRGKSRPGVWESKLVSSQLNIVGPKEDVPYWPSIQRSPWV